MKKAAGATPNQRLIDERLHRHWLQKDVAEQIGTTPITVCRWERGITVPGSHFRHLLCALYAKSAEELDFLPEDLLTSSEHVDSALVSVQDQVIEQQIIPAFPAIWNVPYRRNLFFTGREDIFHSLHQLFIQPTGQICALYGLGGVGKTQTAIEYAYRYRHQYTAVFWVRADTRESLITDYIAIAEALKLLSEDEQDQQRIVHKVLQWLAKNRCWLLIFDNIETIDVVQDFFPLTGEGHILITTRSQTTGTLARNFEIPCLQLAESVFFLLRRAKLTGQDGRMEEIAEEKYHAAARVAQLLDGHPLALDQAGAYIEETNCTVADYSELYQHFQTHLLRRRGKLSLDHPDSVTATLHLCIDKIQRINPAAIELLSLCAFFYPEAIPEEYLITGIIEVNPQLELAIKDQLHLNEAISDLLSCSLIKRDANKKNVTMHRLVQNVLRDMLPDEQRKQWATWAVQTVNYHFPDSAFEVWSQCQLYLPQVQNCIALIEQYKLVFPDAAQLCYKAGHYLLECAQYSSSELLLKQALEIYEQTTGSQHMEAISCLHYLATIYYILGDYDQAEILFQRTLYIRQQVLGTDHPHVAECFNDLASLYYRQGKYAQAEMLFKQALLIWQQIFGPEHGHVAISLNNLARVCLAQVDYEQAEKLLQQALQIWTHAADNKSPDIAFALSNLAKVQQAQGKYAQAEKLFHKSLAIREKTLGKEHLRVATSLNELASLYCDQQKYSQAETLYLRALKIQKNTLGPEHPDVEICIKNLVAIHKCLETC